MASVELHGVTLDYAIYSVRAQSLRSAAVNLAVGGRLLRNQSDTTVVRALSNISFRLQEGDRLGIVGHNGSGKTTLLRVLSGIYEPNQGVIDIRGKVVSMLSASVGLDFEAPGTQNIRNMAMLQGMSKRQIEERLPRIVEFSELGAYIHMPVKTYSFGMLTRLVFSVAVESEADVLIMDEWLSAGDAAFMARAGARVDRLVERAKILILATHDETLVRYHCNKVLALSGGQTVYFGPTQDYYQQHAAA
jgi:lipopolysaccharide transport system ATP-binding protein